MSNFNGTYTETFKLAKPSGNDNVDIGTLNQNMDTLDATLTAGGGTSSVKN